MDIVEKIERLKDKEDETKHALLHLECVKSSIGKMTEEEKCLFECLERRFNDRLTKIHEKLDDIYEIINLANEL